MTKMKKCASDACNNSFQVTTTRRDFCNRKCFLDHRKIWFWVSSSEERARSKIKELNYRAVPDDHPDFDWSIEEDTRYFGYLRTCSLQTGTCVPITEREWKACQN